MNGSTLITSSLYTKDGHKNPNGTTQSQSNVAHPPVPEDSTNYNYSITALVKLQIDFITELSLLQFHALKLGIQLNCTPKCHSETAGEGFEYAWEVAKLFL